MKKITLTEDQLTKIIAQVIKEQEIPMAVPLNTEEEENEDITLLHTRIDNLETQLHKLQDEYSRKIGFGDHHVISHDH